MDIVIGRTANISRDGAQKDETSRTVNKKKKEDRRKNKRDRRKEFRDGVIVTLSTKKDRRVNGDRRKNNPDRY